MKKNERLRKARRDAGMTQVALAEKIGVPQSYVAALEKGLRGLGMDKGKVVAEVLGVDYAWLMNTDERDAESRSLYGNRNVSGNNLKDTENRFFSKDRQHSDSFSESSLFYVPLLPISAQGGSLNDFTVSVRDSDCERIVSPIKGADFAMTVAGESMAPEYPSGSQILVKKINERAFIDWGKTYVIDTCNGTVIKVLVPSDNDGHVRCLSINEDPRYAPFEIAEGDIRGIYRVMMCMSVK